MSASKTMAGGEGGFSMPWEDEAHMTYDHEFLADLKDCLPTGWRLDYDSRPAAHEPGAVVIEQFRLLAESGRIHGFYTNPLLAARDANDAVAKRAHEAKVDAGEMIAGTGLWAAWGAA